MARWPTTRPIFRSEINGPHYIGTMHYVIGPKKGPVKIGISGSAHVRLKEIQTGHPYKLSVLAELAVPEDGHLSEGMIHDFLAPYRTRPNGEWFHRRGEVLRFIEMAFCRLSPQMIVERLTQERFGQAPAEPLAVQK